MKVIIDNGHGIDTKGKRSPKWADGSQLFEWEFNYEGMLETLTITGANLPLDLTALTIMKETEIADEIALAIMAAACSSMSAHGTCSTLDCLALSS